MSINNNSRTRKLLPLLVTGLFVAGQVFAEGGWKIMDSARHGRDYLNNICGSVTDTNVNMSEEGSLGSHSHTIEVNASELEGRANGRYLVIYSDGDGKLYGAGAVSNGISSAQFYIGGEAIGATNRLEQGEKLEGLLYDSDREVLFSGDPACTFNVGAGDFSVYTNLSDLIMEAKKDNDNDGFSNELEKKIGTNPNNPESALRIKRFFISEGMVNIGTNVTNGHPITIYRNKQGLKDPLWFPLGTTSSNGNFRHPVSEGNASTYGAAAKE